MTTQQLIWVIQAVFFALNALLAVSTGDFQAVMGWSVALIMLWIVVPVTIERDKLKAEKDDKP